MKITIDLTSAHEVEMGLKILEMCREEKAIQHLEKPITTLELMVRVENLLKNHGVATLNDLVKLTETDLMRMPNMGLKAITDIKTQLQRFDLTLKTDAVSRSWKATL